MFDISFSELALIFVVALVVLGPERLPKVARTLGRWSGQAKAYMRNLSTELERETQIADIKKQFQEAQAALLESKAALERSTRALSQDVQQRLAPPDQGMTALAPPAGPEAASPISEAPIPPAVTAAAGATPATREPLPPIEHEQGLP